MLITICQVMKKLVSMDLLFLSLPRVQKFYSSMRLIESNPKNESDALFLMEIFGGAGIWCHQYMRVTHMQWLSVRLFPISVGTTLM